MKWHPVLAGLGSLLCIYAIHVEISYTEDHTFQSLCDIGSSMSCSKVLTSKYSHLVSAMLDLPSGHPLDVSNSYYGLLYYLAVLLYPVSPFALVPFRKTLLLLASLMSMGMTVVLAYIILYTLREFCILCSTTWIINIVLFMWSVKEWGAKTTKKTKTK